VPVVPVDDEEVAVLVRAIVNVSGIPALYPVRLSDRLVGDRVERIGHVPGMRHAVGFVGLVELDGELGLRAVDDAIWESVDRNAVGERAAEVGMQVLDASLIDVREKRRRS